MVLAKPSAAAPCGRPRQRSRSRSMELGPAGSWRGSANGMAWPALSAYPPVVMLQAHLSVRLQLLDKVGRRRYLLQLAGSQRIGSGLQTLCQHITALLAMEMRQPATKTCGSFESVLAVGVRIRFQRSPQERWSRLLDRWPWEVAHICRQRLRPGPCPCRCR